jgi:predicted GNAT family acetyltransferase
VSTVTTHDTAVAPDEGARPADDAVVVDVANDREASRYVISVGGHVAGVADYRRRDDRTVFTHTEIWPAFGGRGLGTRLVARAIEGEIAAGQRLVPRCWFVRDHLAARPELAAHVDPG